MLFFNSLPASNYLDHAAFTVIPHEIHSGTPTIQFNTINHNTMIKKWENIVETS